MKKHILTILSFSLIAAFSPSLMAEKVDVRPVYREMNQCIRTLTAKKYKEFVTRYIHPQEAKDIVINDEFIETFEKFHVQRLLQALREAKQGDPRVATPGRIVFKVDGYHQLAFVSYKGKWYISNNNRKSE